ncbi:MAG: Asp-tRNA(Asn)/Glu-tRNA(Gln) amidotransferase subunit GatA [Candidatus Caenarcaniphilales bacterium]|nr:Asp-tRNA(Asn)/Glu-tRNA(Gln) amidotransferase subunit GatA [Candidatus Caenarcaniphilales bacterium]
MSEALHLFSASQIAALIHRGDLTARQVIEYFLLRAENLNPKIKAFNCLTPELALEQARAVDARIEAGERPPLAGVPIAIKDNLCVKGTLTTCSSKILANYRAPYEATVTERLWRAGGICLGKTNLDEFAMGSSTEHSAFSPTFNPWDLERVPGGSSGGSAAAVSARLAPIALGSDTGGSIRQPASLCGIVGLKPTYGYISRFGLIAFASSLDQIGPFANTVSDCDLVMSIIAGEDALDSTSLKVDYPGAGLEALSDLRGVRFGLVTELKGDQESFNPQIEPTLDKTIELLRESGASIEEISMPISTKHFLDVYYIIAPAEASSNLARFDGVRFGLRESEAKDMLSMYCSSRGKGFGQEVIRRIMIGTHALSAGYYDAYYKKAQQVRALIRDEYMKVFEKVDFLLSPTSPVTAFRLGEKLADPLAMYLCDIATIPANLAGIPAISLNAGFDSDNLPIGMQLCAAPLKDKRLLSVSGFLESRLALKNVPEIALA